MRKQGNDSDVAPRSIPVSDEEDTEGVEVAAKPVEMIGEIAERPPGGQGLVVVALVGGLLVGAVVAGVAVHHVDQTEVARVEQDLANAKEVARRVSRELRKQAIADLETALTEVNQNNFGQAAGLAMQARQSLQTAFSLDTENQRLADAATNRIDEALPPLLPPFKKADAQKALAEALSYIADSEEPESDAQESGEEQEPEDQEEEPEEEE